MEEVMNYISRRVKGDKTPKLVDDKYEEGKISSRYSSHSEHTVESKEDFLYKLEETLEKEIDNTVYYCDMALDAENKGHSEFADAFYEVAKGKIECAECIRLRLMKHGHYVPEKQQEIEERYDRAKHLFRRL